mmetsp:Transcript_51108/g.109206  ORF Transcript_51108/g.109206 Transcript_51108/m.109206 type:complete len:209 (-) Transcript_51108:196-822(-)
MRTKVCDQDQLRAVRPPSERCRSSSSDRGMKAAQRPPVPPSGSLLVMHARRAAKLPAGWKCTASPNQRLAQDHVHCLQQGGCEGQIRRPHSHSPRPSGVDSACNSRPAFRDECRSRSAPHSAWQFPSPQPVSTWEQIRRSPADRVRATGSAQISCCTPRVLHHPCMPRSGEASSSGDEKSAMGSPHPDQYQFGLYHAPRLRCPRHSVW